MILSDTDILREIEAGNIIFEPPIDQEDIHPSSVDIHLGTEISVYKSFPTAVRASIDLAHGDIIKVFDELLETVKIPKEGYTVGPGQFVLSTVKEKLTLCPTIAAWLTGRSTNARFGLLIHMTAPTVHATYTGHLTLEICNLGKYPIVLSADFPIGQLIFERLESPSTNPLISPWQGR